MFSDIPIPFGCTRNLSIILLYSQKDGNVSSLGSFYKFLEARLIILKQTSTI